MECERKEQERRKRTDPGARVRAHVPQHYLRVCGARERQTKTLKVARTHGVAPTPDTRRPPAARRAPPHGHTSTSDSDISGPSRPPRPRRPLGGLFHACDADHLVRQHRRASIACSSCRHAAGGLEECVQAAGTSPRPRGEGAKRTGPFRSNFSMNDSKRTGYTDSHM